MAITCNGNTFLFLATRLFFAGAASPYTISSIDHAHDHPTMDISPKMTAFILTATARALTATARAPTPNPSSTPFSYANLTDAPILSSLRIVFTREGNIFMIDRGRPEMQLTFSGVDSGVAISPDGEWIAYRRLVTFTEDHYESELRIMDKNGAVQRVLLSVEDLDSIYPLDLNLEHGGLHPIRLAFIPGTAKLIFSTLTWAMRAPSFFDLHVVDINTGQFQTLLGMSEAVTVTLSPDNEHIAVASGTGVHIINVNSLTIRANIIPHGFFRDGPPWVTFVYPEWAADSSFFVIAVESEQLDGGDWAYGNQIWKIHTGGSPPELLSTITTIYIQAPYNWPLNAKLSLDNNRMYYACPDPNKSPAFNSLPSRDTHYEGVQLCFSDLDGNNLNVYAFPDLESSEGPFEQEGFQPIFNLNSPLNHEIVINNQFRVGIMRQSGLLLIQSGTPDNIFLLAEGVELWTEISLAILD